MKKSTARTALCMVLVLLLVVVGGCSKKNTEPDFKIGVIQFVEHQALDAAYQGFVDGLAEAGYEDGKNIEIVYHNAQGEQANCNTIANTLVNDKCDLILAIATPAAQAAANATDSIPIVITAVTDPADAKLVASTDAPGGNVTGTSDLNPCAEQMELLTRLVPEAKKVAMLYNSSEANSVVQIELAKAAAVELGLETADYTVSSSNEIQQVVEAMVGKVDAIYAPTDNMIAAGMTAVAMVANENGIPVICGESNMVNNGGLATYGLNYYELGKLTAQQAVKILKGEANPADMPIEYLSQFDLYVNESVADQLGITVPDDLAAVAIMSAAIEDELVPGEEGSEPEGDGSEGEGSEGEDEDSGEEDSDSEGENPEGEGSEGEGSEGEAGGEDSESEEPAEE